MDHLIFPLSGHSESSAQFLPAHVQRRTVVD